MRKINGTGRTFLAGVRSSGAVPFHRRLAFTFLLFASLAVGAVRAEPASADRAAILEAIHSLENPRNIRRPGARGELGAYQFREATWRAYTREPFAKALDRSTSDAIAIRHYEWITRQLQAARMPATPYNIALAWNGGVSAAISGRAPKAAHGYAQRAANLTAVFLQRNAYATSR